MKNIKFHLLLRQRGMNVKKLAAAAGVSRPHCSQALNNVPGRGGVNRRQIAPLLTGEELAAIGWAGRQGQPESGDRRQETGGRSQETGVKCDEHELDHSDKCGSPVPPKTLK